MQGCIRELLKGAGRVWPIIEATSAKWGGGVKGEDVPWIFLVNCKRSLSFRGNV